MSESLEAVKAKLSDCRKHNDQLQADKMLLTATVASLMKDVSSLRAQNDALQETIKQLGATLTETK